MSSPNAIQIKKRTQAIKGKRVRSQKENAAPMIGVRGIKGVRKPRVASGLMRRRTITARQITTNADKVPILTSSATSLIGYNPAISAVIDPAMSVGR